MYSIGESVVKMNKNILYVSLRAGLTIYNMVDLVAPTEPNTVQ